MLLIVTELQNLADLDGLTVFKNRCLETLLRAALLMLCHLLTYPRKMSSTY